jgi:hypothetical protein
VYRFWRLLYLIAGSPAAVSLAAMLLRVVGAIGGDSRASHLLDLFERRFVTSGWPGHQAGWTNLHMAECAMRVRRALASTRVVPRHRRVSDAGATLSIGLIGKFSGLLGFPKALFEHQPAGVAVTLLDIEYKGRSAPFLMPLVEKYRRLAADAGQSELDDAAAWLNGLELDLVITLEEKQIGYDLLDRLDVRCLANYCHGSNLLYHDKIDFQYFGQPQVDYFPVNGRMFSGTTQSLFGRHRLADIDGHFDIRGLHIGAVQPWRARRPLITFHGSLYKLASRSYLHRLFGLLQEDSSIEFVMMGKDDGTALSTIEGMARERGLAGRVHYDGVFSAMRDESGEVSDGGWHRLISHLERARLAANPWPVGGGSSRVENYVLGVPCIAIKARFDRASWNRKQLIICEVPGLHVEGGTATSEEDYVAACKRALYDETFADALAQRQLERAAVLTDPGHAWAEIVAGYRQWLSGRLEQGLHSLHGPCDASVRA